MTAIFVLNNVHSNLNRSERGLVHFGPSSRIRCRSGVLSLILSLRAVSSSTIGLPTKLDATCSAIFDDDLEFAYYYANTILSGD